MNSTRANDRVCIPDDILDEILLRLPVKSLLRFKSVSKHWYTIIQNPLFIKSHTTHVSSIHHHHHAPLPHLLIFRRDNRFFSVDPQLEPGTQHQNHPLIPRRHPHLFSCGVLPTDGLRPIGSCHGIICIHLCTSDQLFLWNPAINVCSSIEPLPVRLRNVRRSGFGFVSSLNDYKILLVAEGYSKDRHILVYSLKAKSWSELGANCMDQFPLDELRLRNWDLRSIQLHDALYWFAEYGTNKFVIHRFDLVNEMFDKVDDDRELYPERTFIGLVGDNKLKSTIHPESKRGFTEIRVYDTAGPDGREVTRARCEIEGGNWELSGEDHFVLGIGYNCKVMTLEQDRSCMVFMVIVDARQDPPSYIQFSSQYHPAPYHFDIRCIMSYIPSLLSPCSL